MTGFLDPSVSKENRETVWPRWFQTFDKLLCISLPVHLGTMATCAANIYVHSSDGLLQPLTNKLWLANIGLAFAHGYSWRLATTLMSFSGGKYGKAEPGEVTRLLTAFKKMNRTRTLLVDIPGLICAVTAAMMVI